MATDSFSREEEIRWFVLAGQSNMAGFGDLKSVPMLYSERILVVKRGTTVIAREPLHTEHDRNGAGLGMTFALELVGKTGMRIGLVPTAISGSPIKEWLPGAALFERSVHRMNQAAVHGRIAGVLWHQGETDAMEDRTARLYKDNLLEVVDGFRKAAGDVRLPFIAGELGPFLSTIPSCPFAHYVNRALAEVAAERSDFAVVSSDGLRDEGDFVHFDARSLRLFGTRFAEAYLNLQNGLSTGQRRDN